MKIAIHQRKHSFSERWISYCEREGIAYKVVDAFASDIVAQVKDCDAFLWHHSHAHGKDVITAKRILFALEHAGIPVFPNFRTGWFFDDKVAQKYLLEAMDAPVVPSFVFYDKQSALDWANNTAFPKVFKLKGGAGSANVRLVRSKAEAEKLVNKAFGRGFPSYDAWGGLKERISRWRNGKDSFTNVLKGLGRFVYKTDLDKTFGREKGYAYFQEFMPDNDFDLRIVLVDNRAFAVKRLVRKGDFRASGSGSIIYAKNEIDSHCVQIAFDVNQKLQSQSIAFDFIFDSEKQPLIVEISYGYAVEAYDPCPGYWDADLNWHEGSFVPQEWMIEALLRQVEQKREI